MINREEDLLNKLKEELNNIDFKELFNNYLSEYFKERQIYKHVHSIEEFVGFSGNVCRDYSGELEPFKDSNELVEYIENMDDCEYYDYILNGLHNGQKMASYCSGCGWNYLTIKDDLEEYFDEIKYEKYNKFIVKNKDIILNIFELDYENDKEFEENINDDLEESLISNYIVWDSYEILQNYLDAMSEEDIINIIKNK